LGHSVNENNRHSANDTEKSIDNAILMNVVRQHWENKLEGMDMMKSRHVSSEIDLHLSNINGIIDKLDYEVYCVPSIVSHSKHMQTNEFREYLRLIESMAIGYSAVFGKDITGLILIGLTSKARNVGSAEAYFAGLSDRLSSKLKIYDALIKKHKEDSDSLSREFIRHKSSIFRFIRKKHIYELKSRMDAKAKKLRKLNNKAERINNVRIRLSMRAKS
jgi:hypothetical protein